MDVELGEEVHRQGALVSFMQDFGDRNQSRTNHSATRGLGAHLGGRDVELLTGRDPVAHDHDEASQLVLDP